MRYMVLQSVIMANSITEGITELYYRSASDIRCEGMACVAKPGTEFTTDTYMNIFDAGFWGEYTTVSEWRFEMTVCGSGYVELWQAFDEDREAPVWSCHFDRKEMTVVQSPMFKQKQGMYYCRIKADGHVRISGMRYVTDNEPCEDVRLGLVICTYRRAQDVQHHISCVKASLFCDKKSELYDRLKVCIVDNASELDVVSNEMIKVAHNRNTGGSGGFGRGMEEMRRLAGITHVVLLDDDAKLHMESLYRLYALMSYIRQEHKECVVAGRMFGLDKKNIQYTACEIWNRGDIQHVGYNQDMCLMENLKEMNHRQGEYSGWWMACYTMEYVKKNVPMPFFLHCDDVEYGLRHGGEPVIMNGIQVWHETYENRQYAVIKYYDTRNPIFVNESIGQFDAVYTYDTWKAAISYEHVQGRYLSEYMRIRAMLDFLKGRSWLYKVDSEKLHGKLLKNRHFLRIRNFYLWRRADLKYKKKYRI